MFGRYNDDELSFLELECEEDIEDASAYEFAESSAFVQQMDDVNEAMKLPIVRQAW